MPRAYICLEHARGGSGGDTCGGGGGFCQLAAAAPLGGGTWQGGRVPRSGAGWPAARAFLFGACAAPAVALSQCTRTTGARTTRRDRRRRASRLFTRQTVEVARFICRYYRLFLSLLSSLLFIIIYF